MGCYSPEALPVMSGLPGGFAVADHWFGSVVQFGTVVATDLNVVSDVELTVTSPGPIASGGWT
jgi:hypothetical protein